MNWLKFSSFDFSKDEKGFFYSKYPPPSQLSQGQQDQKKFDTAAGSQTDELKDNKVYYHRLGTPQDQDVLIYEDKINRSLMFEVGVTYDG